MVSGFIFKCVYGEEGGGGRVPWGEGSGCEGGGSETVMEWGAQLQSWRFKGSVMELHNKKYMISSTQITNTIVFICILFLFFAFTQERETSETFLWRNP